MTQQPLDPGTKAHLLALQREEITGHDIYLRLAGVIKDPHNSSVLKRIATEEQKHYTILRHHTGQDIAPKRFKVVRFFWLARIFGLTFGIKLLEQGEEQAQQAYARLSDRFVDIKHLLEDEEKHEKELLDMLDEESLKYAGSVVLGLNDALVELTGALAGLTFAFQNTNLIALAGLITGISASMSMAASEYLSVKAEGGAQNPLKSALYTGVAYVFTVVALILPYAIFSNYIVCLAFTILNAILIIAVFNYYISVARDLSFRRRFSEMAAISLGVAAVSFIIGSLIRSTFGIDI